MLTPTEALIKKLYHNYRHTADSDQQGLFFSPTCIQLCRPIPSYAATTREQIVQYAKDAAKGNVPATSDKITTGIKEEDTENVVISDNLTKKQKESRGTYTFRPLLPHEHKFGDESATSAINFTPSQLLQKSKDEGWVGMRVDIWDMDVEEDGLLVKVQYWWREEAVRPGEEMEGDVGGRGWRQCLHDIMYIGARDGTEGAEGEVLKWLVVQEDQ
jgi:hypothetical protein